MEKEVKPFKSIGSPEACLFELDSDIAFVMILPNFMACDDVQLLCKDCTDATWQRLASLLHDPTLTLPPRLAGPAFANLCNEGIQGLDIAFGKLETVVDILNDCNMKVESLDQNKRLLLKPEYFNTLRNDYCFFICSNLILNKFKININSEAQIRIAW